MHYINIHNKSGHDQEFEVHGWNGNRNIMVKPNATAVLHAEDKSSGAIIALHEGHEGEQAEITKDGFGGKIESCPDHPSPSYLYLGGWANLFFLKRS